MEQGEERKEGLQNIKPVHLSCVSGGGEGRGKFQEREGGERERRVGRGLGVDEGTGRMAGWVGSEKQTCSFEVITGIKFSENGQGFEFT
jgi:hypothetical protein